MRRSRLMRQEWLQGVGGLSIFPTVGAAQTPRLGPEMACAPRSPTVWCHRMGVFLRAHPVSLPRVVRVTPFHRRLRIADPATLSGHRLSRPSTSRQPLRPRCCLLPAPSSPKRPDRVSFCRPDAVATRALVRVCGKFCNDLFDEGHTDGLIVGFLINEQSDDFVGW